ncbi:MAG TPA: hypothetical protein VGX25_34720 [Actinophytocola sp.]|uniref:hypothetical protein n=1 Tax=Actinophytocola sp. TaxID=1872138 RepID=UPI002DDDAFB9|nr:hypothetical protein [Actinophytocola sp.]HEV2784566.1 hypothetical protein [Actinophytocola sp.]
MNRVGLAAAACGLLLLAGCGAEAVPDATHQLQPLTSRSSSASTRADDTPRRADDQRVRVNGLAIAVSAPKPFTPTHSAFPRTPRAVAFEMTIDNEGDTPYEPAQLAVTMLCDGTPAQQVIDSTQGYTGLVTTEEVRPGQNVRLALAFAVPPERVEVRLMVQPSATDVERVTLYTGTV